jgi:hypothetical protein
MTVRRAAGWVGTRNSPYCSKHMPAVGPSASSSNAGRRARISPSGRRTVAITQRAPSVALPCPAERRFRVASSSSGDQSNVNAAPSSNQSAR